MGALWARNIETITWNVLKNCLDLSRTRITRRNPEIVLLLNRNYNLVASVDPIPCTIYKLLVVFVTESEPILLHEDLLEKFQKVKLTYMSLGTSFTKLEVHNRQPKEKCSYRLINGAPVHLCALATGSTSHSRTRPVWPNGLVCLHRKNLSATDLRIDSFYYSGSRRTTIWKHSKFKPVITAPILHLSQPHQTYFTDSHASDYQICCVLFQINAKIIRCPIRRSSWTFEGP